MTPTCPASSASTPAPAPFLQGVKCGPRCGEPRAGGCVGQKQRCGRRELELGVSWAPLLQGGGLVPSPGWSPLLAKPGTRVEMTPRLQGGALLKAEAVHSGVSLPGAPLQGGHGELLPEPPSPHGHSSGSWGSRGPWVTPICPSRCWTAGGRGRSDPLITGGPARCPGSSPFSSAQTRFFAFSPPLPPPPPPESSTDTAWPPPVNFGSKEAASCQQAQGWVQAAAAAAVWRGLT